MDAGQLRQASRRQHQMITLLARETAALAQQAGLPLSESVRHEVEQILHAVLADPQVAEDWAAARLVRAPEATVGFTAVAPDTVPERSRPPARTPSSRASGKPSGAEAARRRAEARRERVERARTRAHEAEVEARRREDALGEAERAHQAAVARAGEAEAHLAELEEQLSRARAELREATEEVGRADTAVKDAAPPARSARRRADRAARDLAALTGDADEA